MLLTILLVVLIILAVGGLPTWGYHQAGYGPSSGLGILVVILIVWMLMGRRL